MPRLLPAQAEAENQGREPASKDHRLHATAEAEAYRPAAQAVGSVPMILVKPSKREPRPKRSIRRRTTPAMKRHAAKVAGWVDPDSWLEVVRFYDGRCSYCIVKPHEQQEHCVPLSRGGKHEIENLTTTCVSCNAKKATRTMFPKRRHPFMLEEP